jgi:hypothetical protein
MTTTYTAGARVVTYADIGAPLTLTEINERLTEHGIYEADDDTSGSGAEPLSDPAGWQFASQTCPYGAAWIGGIPTDGPLPGKGYHQWLLKQAVRLHCMKMLGCISGDDFPRAKDIVERRFTHILATRAQPRSPGPVEIAGAWKYGEQRAATKTEQQARKELGGHEHHSGAGTDFAADTGPNTANSNATASLTGKRSVATQLVEMIRAEYQLGVSDDGTPYGARADAAHIALPLRGGKFGLRADAARRYFETHGSAPSAQALTDAGNVIEGIASQQPPRPLHLRVASHNGTIYIDTADPDNRVIAIRGGQWAFTNNVPVIFKRTELAAPMPDPIRGGDLNKLWCHMNVAEPDRPVLIAVMVDGLIQPDTPKPVTGLLAEHGSAKSTNTRRIVSLIDPSQAPLRMAPRDPSQWVTAAAGSWVVALDNLSDIPDWLSDALCRASTGDADVRRQLYTDTGLSVIAFRRPVIINGIGLGGLNGDLADRLVLVGLDQIGDERRSETELEAQWRADWPAMVGGLLDLAAKVHQRLPGIHMDRLPRMADFGKALAAVDEIHGTDGLERYRERAIHMAADSVAADPFIATMQEIGYTTRNPGGDTAAEILGAVSPPIGLRTPVDWPKKARAVTGRLTRHAPALRKLGWHVSNDGGRNKAKVTRWTIKPPAAESGQSAGPTPTPPPPDSEPSGGLGGSAAGQADFVDPPENHGATSADESAGQAGQKSTFSLLVSTDSQDSLASLTNFYLPTERRSEFDPPDPPNPSPQVTDQKNGGLSEKPIPAANPPNPPANPPTREGDDNACSICGQQMCAPTSIGRGHCERCALAAKRGGEHATATRTPA